MRALPGADVRSHFPFEGATVRGPVRLIAFGAVMFVCGTILAIIFAGDLARPALYSVMPMVATTHFFALGFVTATIMAVMYQFIPANFHANVRGPRRTDVMSVAYIVAVLIFAIAMLGNALVLAAIAGPLLALSVCIFLSQMLGVLLRAKRRTVAGGFHITGFLCLTAVIILGSLLATSLPTAWIADPMRWLGFKILLAVGGWVGMVIIGVSYHTVRGLNGARVTPQFVFPTLVAACGGLFLGSWGVLLAGYSILGAVGMLLLTVAATLYVIDIVRMILTRAQTASAVTWMGQITAGVLLVAAALEGFAAMLGAQQAPAMAVSTILVGVAPVAIFANGNRVVPVLIANRFNGRGRTPLGSTALGKRLMPAAIALLGSSWILIQIGIVMEQTATIRAGAGLLLAAATAFAVVVIRHALAARGESAAPLWTVRESA